ncbi:MAG: GDSL-type esterase/lipase family protein [Bacteroidota bacterium]
MNRWLLISLSVNVIIIAAVVLGGWASARYAGARYKKAYERRVSTFWATEPQHGCILFLGNSITQSGNWNEWLAETHRPVLNRGISGDITRKVLLRLDEVIRHQPAQIYISLGTNDLGKGHKVSEIISDYGQMLDRLKRACGQTQIFIQSVLPVRHRAPNGADNEEIIVLNEGLRTLADTKGCVYIDLHTPFVDTQGLLRAEFTNDDLHVTGAAYQEWMALLRPYMQHMKVRPE